MFDADLTLFDVQHRLGHKSPTLTAKVYTHLMRERFNEGRTKLETYMAAQRHPINDQPSTPHSGHESSRVKVRTDEKRRLWNKESNQRFYV